MNANLQSTIRDEVTLTGVGVHSGGLASVTLHPAPADSGIVFYRAEGEAGGELEIQARYDTVVSTARSTILGSDQGTVATVEHLLAALAGLGIDNVLVEIDGNEVPILDGSAAPFVEAIESVGIRSTSVPRRFIKVLKPVRVCEGDAIGELVPHEGRRIEVEISYDHELIGKQRHVYEDGRSDFGQDVSRARTFGFMHEVETMWARGLALGASLDNTVVIGDGEVVNPEGLRYRDEFVRHKLLDAIGDLSLAGAPILGAYRSVRGGHRLNTAVVAALMQDPTAWTYSYAFPAPRREAAQAELGDMLPAAAYGPEVS